MLLKLYYDEVSTPMGQLSLLSDGIDMLRIDFEKVEANHDKWQKWVKRYFDDVTLVQSGESFITVKRELHAYFTGKLVNFSFQLKPLGTLFQRQVWDALNTQIPYGETCSYQDIAIAIENPKAVRAVGGAVNKNPLSLVIPCHRVIGASGELVGYGGGLDKKRFLLELENQHQSFQQERLS